MSSLPPYSTYRTDSKVSESFGTSRFFNADWFWIFAPPHAKPERLPSCTVLRDPDGFQEAGKRISLAFCLLIGCYRRFRCRKVISWAPPSPLVIPPWSTRIFRFSPRWIFGVRVPQRRNSTCASRGRAQNGGPTYRQSSSSFLIVASWVLFILAQTLY